MGQYDIDHLVMDHGDFHELDYGFDFYAPQTLQMNLATEYSLVGWVYQK